MRLNSQRSPAEHHLLESDLGTKLKATSPNSCHSCERKAVSRLPPPTDKTPRHVTPHVVSVTSRGIERPAPRGVNVRAGARRVGGELSRRATLDLRTAPRANKYNAPQYFDSIQFPQIIISRLYSSRSVQCSSCAARTSRRRTNNYNRPTLDSHNTPQWHCTVPTDNYYSCG